MNIQHTCSRKDCPRKNWPTQEKDLEFARQILFDIMHLSMPKYLQYDTNKAVASELIKEWGKKLNEAVAEHYSTKMQHQILFNILLTLVEIYPDDGLPRKALNEFIANEKTALVTATT